MDNAEHHQSVDIERLADSLRGKFRSLHRLPEKLWYLVYKRLRYHHELPRQHSTWCWLSQNQVIENWRWNSEAVSTLFHNLVQEASLSAKSFQYTGLVEDLKAYCRYRWHRWKAMLRQDYFNIRGHLSQLLQPLFSFYSLWSRQFVLSSTHFDPNSLFYHRNVDCTILICILSDFISSGWV